MNHCSTHVGAKFTKKSKIISVKILITSIYGVRWFGKIALNKVIRSKKILIDKDICWKFGGDKVPGGNKGLGERLSFEVKGEVWDLVTGEESKFDDGRGKLVTFSCLQ